MAIDPKKTLDAYRAKRGEFRLLEIPPLQYLMIDGSGDPNSAPEYRAAVEVLFPIAYALKSAGRTQLGVDTVVMPLEGLWDAEDMQSFTTRRDKSAWRGTLLILVPDHVSERMFADAVDRVEARQATTRVSSPALRSVRLETLREGLSVQTLHVGPYDDEAPVLAELHDHVIPERGLRMTGRHHEIYLGDVRRAAPEKLRTILRQPVERLG